MKKYLDLKNFNYEKDDLFGYYCHIEMLFYGKEGNQYHLFKIVGTLNSNYYYDIPFNEKTNPAKIHDEIIPIANVIHCGICEDEIFRVPLDKIKIIPRKMEE